MNARAQLSQIQRVILANQPRVTRHEIPWDDEQHQARLLQEHQEAEAAQVSYRRRGSHRIMSAGYQLLSETRTPALQRFRRSATVSPIDSLFLFNALSHKLNVRLSEWPLLLMFLVRIQGPEDEMEDEDENEEEEEEEEEDEEDEADAGAEIEIQDGGAMAL